MGRAADQCHIALDSPSIEAYHAFMHISGIRVPPQLPAVESGQWPFTLPAVNALIGQGLKFTHPITFLVGENGSGKSTLVEAIAEAYGLDVRGGHGGRKYGSSIDKGLLSRALHLERHSSPGGTQIKPFS
jgi:predicted ATPase